MPNLVRAAAAIGFLCSLAGCTTPPRHHAQARDWESEEYIAALARRAKPTNWVEAATVPAEAKTALPPAVGFTDTWVPLVRWSQANALPVPVLEAAVPLPTFVLSSGQGTLRVQAGSRVAHWEGLEVRLGFAPQAINGQPFVHTLDLAKTIQPLLLATSAGTSNRPPGNPARLIVIDPGHGGANAGTRSVAGPQFEKDFTLDWARRLQAMLEQGGWRVLLTRSDDRDVEISDRVALAQANKADLFVSLHFNSSSPNDRQAGLETYCLTPTGMPSTVTREYEDDPGEVLPNNAFDAENLRLALSVHSALLEVNGHRDRGVRRARFLGVLRGQQRPAILIEGGYLSNLQEARRIAEPEYRQKLAEAVARGLGVGH